MRNILALAFLCFASLAVSAQTANDYRGTWVVDFEPPVYDDWLYVFDVAPLNDDMGVWTLRLDIAGTVTPITDSGTFVILPDGSLQGSQPNLPEAFFAELAGPRASRWSVAAIPPPMIPGVGVRTMSSRMPLTTFPTFP